jgi:hypothetical protein
VGFCNATQSFAADAIIPYSVIGTNEYNLPVGFKEPINLLLSYNVWSNVNDYHGPEGADYDILVSVNKFARLFTIDGLITGDFCGKAFSGMPEYLGTEDGDNINGMIDPQTGMVAWTKPIPSWTLCFEYWLHLPWGSSDLSDSAFVSDFAWMNNHQWGCFVLDWDIGYRLRGDQRKGGQRNKLGDSLFANAVLTYKVSPRINPALHVDYETAGSGRNKDTNETIASYDRLQVGLGNSMKVSDKLTFDIWYSRGIDGRNVAKTNALYTRFIWAF